LFSLSRVIVGDGPSRGRLLTMAVIVNVVVVVRKREGSRTMEAGGA